jgi:hypothetical protein
MELQIQLFNSKFKQIWLKIEQGIIILQWKIKVLGEDQARDAQGWIESFAGQKNKRLLT